MSTSPPALRVHAPRGPEVRDGTVLDATAVKTYLDYVRAQPTSVAAALSNISNIEVIDELSVGIGLLHVGPGP